MAVDRAHLRKLLARGIAELAVIVIGVSIALWADARSSTTNLRAVESARLVALSASVDTTLVALRAFEEEGQSLVQILRSLFSERADTDPDLRLKFVMDGFLWVPSFQAQLNIYEDLKNSGELAFLTDGGLRQSLAAMQAKLERLSLAQMDLATIHQLNLDRYLIESVDLFPLYSGFLGIEQPRRPTSADLSFVSDREFRNLVLFKLDVLLVVLDVARDLETALVAVQRSLAGSVP